MTPQHKEIGAMGGQATYAKYGREFMSLIARKRWTKERAKKKARR